MDLILVVVLVAGVVCGVQLFLRSLPPGVEPEPHLLVQPFPIATAIALAIIGIITTLQLTVTGSLLDVLERDRSAIASGQVWRIATALTTQDGGVAGAVFNLSFLAVLGILAERTLGHRRAIVGWCGGALAGELAGLAWQPLGAGNSVGNFGLIGAMAVAGFRGRRRSLLTAALLAIGVGGIVLLVGRNLHGAALAGGAAVSALVGWRSET